LCHGINALVFVVFVVAIVANNYSMLRCRCQARENKTRTHTCVFHTLIW